MKIANVTLLRDALQNLATDSGASDDYARGVTLGIVSALMATNKRRTFNAAFALVKANLPANVRPNYAPACWLK